MSARETAREVADQAAEWAIRIDGGSIDPDTDEGLRRWLDEVELFWTGQLGAFKAFAERKAGGGGPK